MLPFRSGRAGFARASSAFFVLASLACAALAADKSATPAATALPKKKERKPEEGVTNVPLATGHDAKGLVLPDFDLLGRLRGKLEAGVSKRLDEERIEFHGVKFTTLVPDTQTPDLEVVMKTSTFNLKTQILNSNERTSVKRADFEVAGDNMKFEMLTRIGTLSGNVKMVVHGKARTPQDAKE